MGEKRLVKDEGLLSEEQPLGVHRTALNLSAGAAALEQAEKSALVSTFPWIIDLSGKASLSPTRTEKKNEEVLYGD